MCYGPMLSLRGLDNALYYRHHPDEPGALVNDTGTGNTLAFERAPVRDLVIHALRHLVMHGGVDGFRFDLATVLGRTARGFVAACDRCLRRSAHDPVLADRMLIAEPWDIGPGGYQLGNFPPQFPRMERPLPRRCPPLLARRSRIARRAGDTACRLVRLFRPLAGRRTARSISSPPMTG